MQLFSISLLFRKSEFEVKVPKSVLIAGLAVIFTIMVLPTCEGAIVLSDADTMSIRAGDTIEGYCCFERKCSWDECASDKEREDTCILCSNYTDSTWRKKAETVPSDPIHVCRLDYDTGDCGTMCWGTCTEGVCNGTVPDPENKKCKRYKKDGYENQNDCPEF